MACLKKAVGNLGLLLAAMGILGGVLEAGLAMTRINTKAYLRFIPDKGTTFIPKAYYRFTKEGFSEGYFNSHGFRDYERTYEKAAGTFRILIFGDSYVEASQVALSDAFPALLEKRLNAHSTATKFEVLNLGQGGFGTVDEYMRYMNFGVKYSPDLVILAFLTGNDFLDNSKFLSQESHGFYFVFDNNNLVLDRSVIDKYQGSLTLSKRLFQALKQKSYLANLISERFYLLREEIRTNRFKKHVAADRPEGVERKLDEFSVLNIYLPELSMPWREAVDLTKGVILKFRDAVEEHSARFVLVTLSNAEQVHPHMQQALHNTYGLPFDYSKPDRMLEEFARQSRIPMLQLMPMFLEYHLKTGKYLHGFGSSDGGHWNKNGHCLAAEKIFAFLQEKGLVSVDSTTGRAHTQACGTSDSRTARERTARAGRP